MNPDGSFKKVINGTSMMKKSTAGVDTDALRKSPNPYKPAQVLNPAPRELDSKKVAAALVVSDFAAKTTGGISTTKKTVAVENESKPLISKEWKSVAFVFGVFSLFGGLFGATVGSIYAKSLFHDTSKVSLLTNIVMGMTLDAPLWGAIAFAGYKGAVGVGKVSKGLWRLSKACARAIAAHPVISSCAVLLAAGYGMFSYSFSSSVQDVVQIQRAYVVERDRQDQAIQAGFKAVSRDLAEAKLWHPDLPAVDLKSNANYEHKIITANPYKNEVTEFASGQNVSYTHKNFDDAVASMEKPPMLPADMAKVEARLSPQELKRLKDDERALLDACAAYNNINIKFLRSMREKVPFMNRIFSMQETDGRAVAMDGGDVGGVAKFTAPQRVISGARFSDNKLALS